MPAKSRCSKHWSGSRLLAQSGHREQEIACQTRQPRAGAAALPPERKDGADFVSGQHGAASQSPAQSFNYKAAQTRKVSPQSSVYQLADKMQFTAGDEPQANLSKVVPAEAEFDTAHW